MIQLPRGFFPLWLLLHPNVYSLIYWVGQNVLWYLGEDHISLRGSLHYRSCMESDPAQCLEHRVGCSINGSAINITDWLSENRCAQVD